MKTKAIKIDAENQKIEEIEIDDYRDMQAAVGGLIELAFCSQSEEGEPVDLYINEEGRINGTDYGFGLTDDNGEVQLYYGNGLVCGVNHETGDKLDAPVSVEDVRHRVKWALSKNKLVEKDFKKNNRNN
jgi:hypothetical protein